jgi:hypothetical protein
VVRGVASTLDCIEVVTDRLHVARREVLSTEKPPGKQRSKAFGEHSATACQFRHIGRFDLVGRFGGYGTEGRRCGTAFAHGS